MSNYDNTNRFVLFINDNSDNPKAPKYKGTVNINGTDYKIAGWVKQAQSGVEYISGSVELPDTFTPSAKAATANDDIPF